MKKVFVGLSGGVDSSVSAALLKKQGFDVIGIFIRVWNPEWLTCDWKEERRDAMRVAAHLHIPFRTLDLQKEYKRDVADYMISEYERGRTPNPDVMCNKSIKFGGFLEYALKEGADYIATGHYTQTKNGRLYTGVDQNKDQSYFLWTLTDKQLQHTLFPVGHLEKKDVRILAEKYSLPTALKKDSQGVCFLGKLDMRDFLQHYIEKKEGNVIHEKGSIIGTHEGSVFYTIGQRHGFTITDRKEGDAPMYVIAKDIKKNTLTVAGKKSQNDIICESHTVILKDLYMRNSEAPVRARIRYRQTLQDCSVHNSEVSFTKPQSVAVGQSVVFYNKDECMGGGIIERVL